ncbi:MAG: hypothetical protein ACOYI8_00815 [Christensenellales bacterium]|jgi:hypothetical protein
MTHLTELLHKDKDALLGDIRAAKDISMAADVLVRHLDMYRVRVQDDLKDKPQKQALNRLCRVASEGCRMVLCASKAELAEVCLPEKQKKSLRELLFYLPTALCVSLSALLAAEGRWTYAAIALGAAAICFFTAGRGGDSAKVRYEPVPAIDTDETLRRFESLLLAIDRAMDELAPDAADQRKLPQGLMEAIQMLKEAQLTRDGAFALRTIPQMESALVREGIVMVPYSNETRQYFDLLPAPEGGHTIRPALMQNGVLIARGQATIRI